MKLKRQLLGFFYAAAIGAVLVGTVGVYALLTPVVSDFEQDAARRELARVEAAFLQTLTTLYARTRDWAERQQVESLVMGDTSEPPRVPGDLPDNLRLDIALTFAEDGKAQVWRGEGLASAEIDALYQSFRDRACYPVWGATRFAQRPYLIAMHPVGDCGAALFAVALDTQLSSELSGITGLDVALVPASEHGGRQVDIDAHNDGYLLASFPVVDYQQQPLLRTEIRLPREIYQRGMPMIWSIGLTVLGVALAVATLVFWFVQRRVFGRLARLHQAVRRIAQGGDMRQRMRVRGNDELAEIAADFNAMVDHINDAQQSLAQASERAEAANRAKSLFLANMSHEIRTPMTAILGYAELLENPELGEQERRRYLAIIQQNGDALMALISDVLDLSRIEAGQVRVERQPCDIPALMKDVLNSHMLRARHKRIELSLRYLDAVPREIYTDAFRLRQILGNLVSNAIKFTEEGGVEVRVRWEEGLQPCLHVDIADTGIGIPAAALPHVFEPFSQVDESHTRRFGGTGLGLAIARQLARSLGGDISVRSEPRAGSVFQVYIQTLAVEGSPRVQPAEALAFEMQSQRLPAIRASGTVLVVDDNQVNRLLVTRVLGNAGFVVHEAENGQQALDAVAADGAQFDLVVMDMQMPVMDGFAASSALRQRGYRGAVLALTANVMADDRRRCLDAGCDEFLGKPVRAGQLLETCVRLINSSAVASRRA